MTVCPDLHFPGALRDLKRESDETEKCGCDNNRREMCGVRMKKENNRKGTYDDHPGQRREVGIQA